MSFNRMAYFGNDLSGVSLGIQNNNVIISSINKSDSSLTKLNIKASSTDIIGDLSANDASFNNIYISGNLLDSNGNNFESKINQNTDLSLNNIKIHGNLDIIGNGDISGNDASFNVVNVNSLNVNGSSVSGDINGISEDTYSRYTSNISGTTLLGTIRTCPFDTGNPS